MITAAHLEAAKVSEKRIVESLEEQLACPPAEFVRRLAETLRMPAASLEELRQETPAFDLIPYADAARRSCVALRDAEGDLSVVLGDPYDLDAQDWIEARLGGMSGEQRALPFRYRLAHRQDVARDRKSVV